MVDRATKFAVTARSGRTQRLNSALLRNHSRRDRYQLVVMMQTAETRIDNDAMSGR